MKGEDRVMFWILWGINAIISLVAVVFFLIGLADGSVSSFNMTLWLAILLALAVILRGGHALRAAGRVKFANGLLMLLAIPGVLSGLLLLAAIILQPRWN